MWVVSRSVYFCKVHQRKFNWCWLMHNFIYSRFKFWLCKVSPRVTAIFWSSASQNVGNPMWRLSNLYNHIAAKRFKMLFILGCHGLLHCPIGIPIPNANHGVYCTLHIYSDFNPNCVEQELVSESECES